MTELVRRGAKTNGNEYSDRKRQMSICMRKSNRQRFEQREGKRVIEKVTGSGLYSESKRV